MPIYIDPEGNPVSVKGDARSIKEALARGLRPRGGNVKVQNTKGEIVELPADVASDRIGDDYTAPDYLPLVEREAESYLEEEYGGFGQAALRGTARGLTLGLSRFAEDDFAAEQVDKRSPITTTTFDIGSTVAAAMLTGGGNLLARGGAEAGKQGAKQFAKRAIARSAKFTPAGAIGKLSAKAGQKTLEKTGSKIAALAAEGAAFDAGVEAVQQLGNVTLGDDDFTVETVGDILGAGLRGAAIGGGLGVGGAVLKGGIKGAASTGKKVEQNLRKAELVEKVGKIKSISQADDATFKQLIGTSKKIGDDLVDEAAKLAKRIETPADVLDLPKSMLKEQGYNVELLEETLDFKRALRKIKKVKLGKKPPDNIAELLNKVEAQAPKMDEAFGSNFVEIFDKASDGQGLLNKFEMSKAAFDDYDQLLKLNVDEAIESGAKATSKSISARLSGKLSDTIAQGIAYTTRGTVQNRLGGGLVASAIAGPTGAAVREVVRYGVEKAAKAKAISKVADKVIDYTGKAATSTGKTGTTATATISAFQVGGTRGKESNDVKRITAELDNALANEAALRQSLATSAQELVFSHPDLVSAAADNYINKLRLYQQAAPRPPDHIASNPFIKSKWKPGPESTFKFKSTIAGGEAPLESLEEMISTNKINQTTLATIEKLHPGLIAQFREKTLTALLEVERELPYQRRLVIGRLLDMPLDYSDTPDFMRNMQSNYEARYEEEQASTVSPSGPTPEPPKPTPGQRIGNK